MIGKENYRDSLWECTIYTILLLLLLVNSQPTFFSLKQKTATTNTTRRGKNAVSKELTLQARAWATSKTPPKSFEKVTFCLHCSCLNQIPHCCHAAASKQLPTQPPKTVSNLWCAVMVMNLIRTCFMSVPSQLKKNVFLSEDSFFFWQLKELIDI